jgi:hypothetical protein
MNTARLLPAGLLGLAMALTLPFAALLPATATAQEFRHPAYLHSVPLLRDARWLLEWRERGPGEERERAAQVEIDRALQEVERAAAIDNRFVYQPPRQDAYPGPARLRRASELLRAARADITLPEDLPAARALQYRAIGHIDAAIRLTEEVMIERERMREGYYR